MKITDEQVKRVAELARIALTPEQVERFSKELSTILTFVEELNQVDTKGVAETSHVTGLSNVVRADDPHAPVDRQTFLDGAPAHQQGQVKVPGVFSS